MMQLLSADETYASLVHYIMEYGNCIKTRNSNVKRIFGEVLTFDKTPLVSIRKTAWKTACREWAWYMSGSNFLADAHPSVRPWWQPWVNSIGRVMFNYATQFRSFGGHDRQVDQIQLLIDGIKNHPYSRRNVATSWNPTEMTDPLCRLTTCHGSLIQCFVNPDNTLHMTMYQRSSDVIVGLGANWIQYWSFLLWLAHRTGRSVGSFTWIGGDVHIYQEHFDLANEIINRAGEVKPTPNLVYTPTSEDFKADDFSLDGEYCPIINQTARMIV